jgi:AraC-like DNA-binding protein
MAGEPIAESVSGQPHPLLRPYVRAYDGYHHRGFGAGEHMGLPSRHLTFIVQFDDPLELVMDPGGRGGVQRLDALLSGFHTRPAVIRHDGNQHGVQLRITPAGARALFGFPAGAVAADAVPLDAAWGALARELVDRLDSASDWPTRFAVLDQVLMRAAAGRAEAPSGERPETAAAWHQLVATDGRIDVATIASEVGWSRRHLTDRFTSEYGFGPKEMARVLRFERSKVMFLRPEHPTLATIAAECGYADQAHMARDWRALAGASPTQWLAAEQLPLAVLRESGDAR